jgi:hypothetical protein
MEIHLFHNKLSCLLIKLKGISFVSSNMETYCWKIEVVSFEKKQEHCICNRKWSYSNDFSKEVAFIEELTEFRKNNGSLGWYHRLLDLGYDLMLFCCSYHGFHRLVLLVRNSVDSWKSVVLIQEEYDNKLGKPLSNKTCFFGSSWLG